MDLQRTAGQGEAKAQQNPQPQVPPTAPGGAEGAPVGVGVRFRLALAGRALPVHAKSGHMLTTFPSGKLLTTRYRVYITYVGVEYVTIYARLVYLCICVPMYLRTYVPMHARV